MFNQVFLVGKLESMPQKLESIDETHLFYLSVSEPYRTQGKKVYQTIPVLIWSGASSMLKEKFKIGTYLCVKGRLINAQNKSICVKCESIDSVFE